MNEADLKLVQKLKQIVEFCKTHPKLTYGNTQKWHEETLQFLADCHEFFQKLDVIIKEA